MSKTLPPRPSLEQLKNQAKDLLKSVRSGNSEAGQRFKEFHPNWLKEFGSDSHARKPTLSDAQLVLAREHGFSSWPKLKEHVESLERKTAPMEELATAVKANDVVKARQALADFPELRAQLNDPLPDHGFGSTLLLVAVQRTAKEMIDFLLGAGADINARSRWWAGSFGVLDDDHGLASFLIERGAMVDVHAAARLGRLDRLEKLISENPKLVHARGGDGQTPLHFATTIEVVNYLLENGADIDARDIDHESTPAQYMVRERQELARHLVARGCRTDILMAAALGDLELVRKHLDADPTSIRMSVSHQYFPKRNPRSGGTIYTWTLGQNKTAHMVARQFGHEEIFQLLMERSPQELKLAQACEVGDEALVKSLAASQPNLKKTLTGDDGRRLADAAQNNNIQAVRLMLESGWPVDARGQHGATSLHWAAFHGNAEMIGTILRHHPTLELTDFDFRGTPLGWAIHGSEHGWNCRTGNYPGTVEALLRAGAKPPEKVTGTEAVKEVLRRFLANG